MAAAKRFNWPPSTYAAHENGQNLIPVDVADRYAQAFRISVGWLLSGEGEIERRNIVRVEGLVGAGGSIDTSAEGLGPDGLEEIELPLALTEDCAGYRVTGTSMFPRYDDGDIIVVSRQPQSPDDLLYLPESMVTTIDGARYLKRIVPGNRKGIYDLESFNAPPMRNVKLQNATRVQVVVRRGEWKRLDASGRKRTVQRQLRKAQ